MQEMHQYHNVVQLAYKGYPEAMSLALLLIMEMWQALDAAALVLYPLLRDYPPAFPQNLLYFLQVSHIKDMRRLRKVEEYMSDRRKRAITDTLDSVFGELTKTSFAFQYYDQSLEMQELHEELLTNDDEAIRQKRVEWDFKSEEERHLSQEAAGTACVMIDDQRTLIKRNATFVIVENTSS